LRLRCVRLLAEGPQTGNGAKAHGGEGWSPVADRFLATCQHPQSAKSRQLKTALPTVEVTDCRVQRM
jgi:hypothetical protein